MAEADAEDGDAAKKLLNIFDGVPDRLRITGAIGKKNAIRFEIENVLGAGLRGDDPNIAMMIDQQAENILLDAEIVGGNAKFGRVRSSARLAHGLRPRRNGQLDGAFFPAVGALAGDAACKLLPGHGRQLLGFVDELIGGRAVGGDNAAKRADIANVANERARVDIPDDGNFVAIQIELSGFRGAPIRGDLRKFAHDERFDVGTRRFFIVEIGANVSNMRVGQTNDLARVTWVRENFLITGEAGIENDFAAAARDRAGSAAVKDAPVFQSERGGPVRNFGQMVLPV